MIRLKFIVKEIKKVYSHINSELTFDTELYDDVRIDIGNNLVFCSLLNSKNDFDIGHKKGKRELVSHSLSVKKCDVDLCESYIEISEYKDTKGGFLHINLLLNKNDFLEFENSINLNKRLDPILIYVDSNTNIIKLEGTRYAFGHYLWDMEYKAKNEALKDILDSGAVEKNSELWYAFCSPRLKINHFNFEFNLISNEQDIFINNKEKEIRDDIEENKDIQFIKLLDVLSIIKMNTEFIANIKFLLSIILCVLIAIFFLVLIK